MSLSFRGWWNMTHSQLLGKYGHENSSLATGVVATCRNLKRLLIHPKTRKGPNLTSTFDNALTHLYHVQPTKWANKKSVMLVVAVLQHPWQLYLFFLKPTTYWSYVYQLSYKRKRWTRTNSQSHEIPFCEITHFSLGEIQWNPHVSWWNSLFSGFNPNSSWFNVHFPGFESHFSWSNLVKSPMVFPASQSISHFLVVAAVLRAAPADHRPIRQRSEGTRGGRHLLDMPRWHGGTTRKTKALQGWVMIENIAAKPGEFIDDIRLLIITTQYTKTTICIKLGRKKHMGKSGNGHVGGHPAILCPVLNSMSCCRVVSGEHAVIMLYDCRNWLGFIGFHWCVDSWLQVFRLILHLQAPLSFWNTSTPTLHRYLELILALLGWFWLFVVQCDDIMSCSLGEELHWITYVWMYMYIYIHACMIYIYIYLCIYIYVCI